MNRDIRFVEEAGVQNLAINCIMKKLYLVDFLCNEFNNPTLAFYGIYLKLNLALPRKRTSLA